MVEGKNKNTLKKNIEKKSTGKLSKQSAVGVMSPREAFDYIIFTHAIEGLVFSEDEKMELLKNIENGICEDALADLAVQYGSVSQ